MRLTCTIDGCEKYRKGHGLCSMHYHRWRRNGDPELRRAPGWINPRAIPVIDRVLASVVETPGPLDTPCWITEYAPYEGYVRVWDGDHNVRAHRLTYEHFVGPIPAGLVIDHLCRVTNCCNPEHLEPVTHAENVRRGISPSAIATRTDMCKRGHSLVDAPVRADGGRRCRTCHREYEREHPRRAVKS